MRNEGSQPTAYAPLVHKTKRPDNAGLLFPHLEWILWLKAFEEARHLLPAFFRVVHRRLTRLLRGIRGALSRNFKRVFRAVGALYHHCLPVLAHLFDGTVDRLQPILAQLVDLHGGLIRSFSRVLHHYFRADGHTLSGVLRARCGLIRSPHRRLFRVMYGMFCAVFGFYYHCLCRRIDFSDRAMHCPHHVIRGVNAERQRQRDHKKPHAILHCSPSLKCATFCSDQLTSRKNETGLFWPARSVYSPMLSLYSPNLRRTPPSCALGSFSGGSSLRSEE